MTRSTFLTSGTQTIENINVLIALNANKNEIFTDKSGKTMSLYAKDKTYFSFNNKVVDFLSPTIA